jgi:2-oxoacid:acceptor oxidoreductase gamma subunit (pyruvate/2-ketoisovalerate family)
MIEIKFAGRGGQGAVLASQILAHTLFRQGLWVQAFPSFGAERRGAPVAAFLRVDSEEITLRCGIARPDWLVVFDAGLLENPMVVQGADAATAILLNSRAAPARLAPGLGGRLFHVDATGIAEALGLKTTSFTIVNTAMVGAFAGASGLVDIAGVSRTIMEKAPVKAEENAAAARRACEQVREVPHE